MKHRKYNFIALSFRSLSIIYYLTCWNIAVLSKRIVCKANTHCIHGVVQISDVNYPYFVPDRTMENMGSLHLSSSRHKEQINMRNRLESSINSRKRYLNTRFKCSAHINACSVFCQQTITHLRYRWNFMIMYWKWRIFCNK